MIELVILVWVFAGALGLVIVVLGWLAEPGRDEPSDRPFRLTEDYYTDD